MGESKISVEEFAEGIVATTGFYFLGHAFTFTFIKGAFSAIFGFSIIYKSRHLPTTHYMVMLGPFQIAVTKFHNHASRGE